MRLFLGEESGEGERLVRGVTTPGEKHAEILDGLLDGIAIVRPSDGELVYANPALAPLLGAEPDELEGAVGELVRSGRTTAIELAHPELGLIRLVVVPRDSTRATERAWRRDLRRELARARRRGWSLTVGAIALDAGAGTAAAASAWGEALRAEDSVAPYEEGVYVLILPDCPPEAVEGVAQRIRNATPAPATLSLGFTTTSGDERPDTVLARALAALAETRAGAGNL